MNTKRLLLVTLLACLLPPALAEEAAAPAPQADLPYGLDEGQRVIRRSHVQVVKNAPYSAQAVSERLQQLPDGNQIERRTSAASYRDSAGRTRHEVRDARGELRRVTINDPVAGALWILNPQERSARRLPSRAEIDRIARDAREKAREQVERMRKEGRLPAPERGAEAGERAAIRVERQAADSSGTRDTVRVIRLPRMPALDAAEFRMAPLPQLAPLGPMIANAVADMKWASRAVTRDLGTRDFDGVRAEGKLRSYEIPAGEVGNRNPIVVASETWHAPELQVTVYSKHSDPRSGEYIYRLEGLKRGEPDPGLFTVPADYTVRDTHARAPRVPGRSGE